MATEKKLTARDLRRAFGRPGAIQGYAGADMLDPAEYNSKFTDVETAQGIYTEMLRSDSQVAAVRYAVDAAIGAVQWSVELPEDPTADERRVGELVRLVVERDGWHDAVLHAASSLWLGFAVQELVWTLQEVDGRRALLPTLEPRQAYTCTGWVFDDLGRLRSVEQTGLIGAEPMPRSKIVLHSFRPAGGDPRGVPFLRATYRDWFIKHKLELYEAIAAERSAVGLPHIHIEDMSAWASTEEAMAAAKDVAQNIRSHEQSYALTVGGMSISMLDFKSRGQFDVGPAVKRHDEAIARSALLQFLNFGSTEHGARALGESAQEFFIASLTAVVRFLRDGFQADLVKRIAELNAPPGVRVPRLSFLRPESLPAGVLAALPGLVQATLLTPDEDTEAALRARLDLPARQKRTDQVSARQLSDGDSGVPSSGQAPTGPAPLTGPGGRALREPELHVRFRELAGRMDDAVDVIARATASIRADAARVLAEQAREALAGDNPAAAAKLRVPVRLLRSLRDVLAEELAGLYRAGRRAVAEELASQAGARQRAAAGQAVALSDTPELDELPPAVRKRLLARAELETDQLLDPVERAARQRVLDAQRTGRPWSDEDTIALVERSDRSVKVAAGYVVSEALGQGRKDEAEARRDVIDRALYSAVMDANTCDPCAEADGLEVSLDDPLYAEMTPPLYNCEGGGRCRCIWVYVLAEEARSVR